MGSIIWYTDDAIIKFKFNWNYIYRLKDLGGQMF